MKLSENLGAILKSADMTPSRLSRELDLPQATLHGWLNGVEPKNLKQVLKVAKYFEISIEELCFSESPQAVSNPLKQYDYEISTGVYEVVLRKVRGSLK